MLHLIKHCTSCLLTVQAELTAVEGCHPIHRPAAQGGPKALCGVRATLQPLIDAAAGQAVAEATMALTLAVLQGISEDSGMCAALSSHCKALRPVKPDWQVAKWVWVQSADLTAEVTVRIHQVLSSHKAFDYDDILYACRIPHFVQ